MGIACELCHYAGRVSPYYPARQIVKCPSCGLIYYDEEVAAETLYTQTYFEGGEYFDYLADKEILQHNFRQRIKRLRQLKPSGRLLELGSAYGFFLELAQKYWSVEGVDVTSAGVEYTRQTFGIKARLADFLTLPDDPGSYDVICLWDTVEHLAHPVRYIEKAAQWLQPGGILALTTGDIESWPARLQKEHWRLIHPPTHLFYFSPNTLTRAAQQAGLEVISVSHVGYSRSYRAMLHGLLLLKSARLKGLYRLLTLDNRIDFPIYLNLYDIMQFIARKP